MVSVLLIERQSGIAREGVWGMRPFQSKLLGAVFAAVVLAQATAPAAGVTVGEAVSGYLTVGEKQVPLPRGEWVVAGLGVQKFDMAEIGAYGAIQNIVLFQRRGDRVVAAAEINVNAIPVNDGWGRTAACQRGRQFLTMTRYRTGWELSCLFVQPTFAPVGVDGPQAWADARRLAATAGHSAPDLWLTAGFRISDRQDVVDARYHFDPALFLGADAPATRDPALWEAEAVKADPALFAAAQIMSVWAIAFDGWIERGLRNQIGDAVADAPNVAPFLTDTPQIDAKLLALERMHRAGLIGKDEYRWQQRLALREQPVIADLTSGGLPLSVQKNISFRTFGSSVDYILAFIVTASNPLSSFITASIVAIHSVIFVLNDNWWEDYWAKRSTRDASRMVDFTYVGKNDA